MKVLVTGATGFVGKQLVKKLIEAGDQVVVLTRDPGKCFQTFQEKVTCFKWEPEMGPPEAQSLVGIDGVIHLAGENIGDKRWSKKQKEKIYNSRILSTRHLMQGLSHLSPKLKVIVSTSAIGIYGDRKSEFLAESSTIGGGFLASVCEHWEREVLKKADVVERAVIIRKGVVLGKDGGALKKLLPIFKTGLGGPIGCGSQWMSWIHEADLVELYLFALKNANAKGIYNGVSPYPATNADFSKKLGKTLCRPAIFVVPPPALKLLMGEMSAIVLDSQKVVSERLQMDGFTFKFGNLDKALQNICNKS